MIRSKLGLKALGLCALVLGLTAFASGVAQAEPGASWGYKKTAGSALEKFSTSLEAGLAIEIENKTASLLFTTGGGTKVEILCAGAEFDEGGTLSANGSILLGRIKFTGCIIKLNGTVSGPCKPTTALGSGTILSNKFDGLIVLHNGQPVVLILSADPEESKNILVNIELGPECSIGEKVPVTGDLVLWDCKGKTSFETHAVTHLIEEFPSLHLLVALGKPALLDGSANVKLTGTHTGYLWAGLGAFFSS
jgi:hypothetical protein